MRLRLLGRNGIMCDEPEGGEPATSSESISSWITKRARTLPDTSRAIGRPKLAPTLKRHSTNFCA